MIETREQLIHTLTEAAEIEDNLLCSCLYAVFSLKREGEASLSPRQAEAVEGWRKTILKMRNRSPFRTLSGRGDNSWLICWAP